MAHPGVVSSDLLLEVRLPLLPFGLLLTPLALLQGCSAPIALRHLLKQNLSCILMYFAVFSLQDVSTTGKP